MAEVRRDDHVENNRKVDVVGDRPCEPDELVIFAVDHTHDGGRRGEHPTNVVRPSMSGPPLPRKEMDQLVDTICVEHCANRHRHVNRMPGRQRIQSVTDSSARRRVHSGASGNASTSEQEDHRHRRRRFNHTFEREAGLDQRIEIGGHRTMG